MSEPNLDAMFAAPKNTSLPDKIPRKAPHLLKLPASAFKHHQSKSLHFAGLKLFSSCLLLFCVIWVALFGIPGAKILFNISSLHQNYAAGTGMVLDAAQLDLLQSTRYHVFLNDGMWDVLLILTAFLCWHRLHHFLSLWHVKKLINNRLWVRRGLLFTGWDKAFDTIGSEVLHERVQKILPVLQQNGILPRLAEKFAMLPCCTGMTDNPALVRHRHQALAAMLYAAAFVNHPAVCLKYPKTEQTDTFPAQQAKTCLQTFYTLDFGRQEQIEQWNREAVKAFLMLRNRVYKALQHYGVDEKTEKMVFAKWFP